VPDDGIPASPEGDFEVFLIEEIRVKLDELPPLTVDKNGDTNNVHVDLFETLEEAAA
jgi:hypothetical protein